jgi:hypothetical protein
LLRLRSKAANKPFKQDFDPPSIKRTPKSN